MSLQLTLILTVTSGICALLLVISLLQFILQIRPKNTVKLKNSIHPLVKYCGLVSLLGYTLFVLISFALYLLQLIWYIIPSQIQYSIILCQLETFNITFFMTGKLAMYLYFMSLVHVAFKDSTFAYSKKLIGSISLTFFCLMCIIGGFYMTFLYFDFEEVGSMTSPSDCQNIETSIRTTITIYTGASCDALWSFVCLLLFYSRLRKLSQLMKSVSSQRNLEMVQMKQEMVQMNIENASNIDDNASDSHIESSKDTNVSTTAEGETNVFALQTSDPTMDTLNESEQLPPNHTNTAAQDTKQRIKTHVREETLSSAVELSFPKKVRSSLRFKLKIERKKKSDIHKFLPIMLKLSILSGWCAFSTVALGFGIWRIYPTLSSVIDSTINAFCVYLSFTFAKRLYSVLCLPFISCKNCRDYRIVIREANEMSM